MAFKDRFNGKTEIVGKDGNGRAANAAPVAPGGKAVKSGSMPMPMPMPMPMAAVPPQQQQHGHAQAPPEVAVASSPPAAPKARHPVAGRRASPSPSAPPAKKAPAAKAAGMPMPMPMPAPSTPPQAQPHHHHQPHMPTPAPAPAAASLQDDPVESPTTYAKKNQPNAVGSGVGVVRAGRRAPPAASAKAPPAATAAMPPPAPTPQYTVPTSFQAPIHPQQQSGFAMPLPTGMGADLHGGGEQPNPYGGYAAQHHNNTSSGAAGTSPTTQQQQRPGFIPPAPLKTGEAPKYVPYSVEDFKKINKPVRLGGLGPNDSDEIREARERRKQAIEYASNNNRVNLVVLAAAEDTVAKKPTGKQPSKELQEVIDRRERMKEFAKNVPKPKPKKDAVETTLDDEIDNNRRRGAENGYGVEDDVPAASNEKLLELEERHRRDQEMISAMKRQLGLNNNGGSGGGNKQPSA